MAKLILPLPPKELKVNRALGVHWGSTRPFRKAYQLQVAVAARAQRAVWEGKPQPYPVAVRVVAYLGKGQRCDISDLGSWTKGLWDALIAVGVWRDDGSKFLRPMTFDVARDAANPRVEVVW